MPRPAKLRKKPVGKATYWATELGGEYIDFGNINTNFGNILEVTHKQAKILFNEHVKSLSDGTNSSNGLSFNTPAQR